jgi:hypothetical protein
MDALQTSRASALLPGICLGTFPSSRPRHPVHTNVGSDNHMTYFVSERRLDLVETSHTRLMGYTSTTVSREWEV